MGKYFYKFININNIFYKHFSQHSPPPADPYFLKGKILIEINVIYL